jgi:hypothetical protein
MSTSADCGRIIWAVLPPLLSERFAEGFTSKEGISGVLKNIADRLVTNRSYFKSAAAKADELEQIVFDDESPSWGVWPLWIDHEGLELCGAIGILLGCRLTMALADCDVTDNEAVKEVFDGLIEAKAAA